jgi:hypothetical protein
MWSAAPEDNRVMRHGGCEFRPQQGASQDSNDPVGLGHFGRLVCSILSGGFRAEQVAVLNGIRSLQPEYLQPEYLSRYGRLRIEDVNEDSCPGRGIGFSHDVLDVFFHGLFGNLKSVRDLFVGPPLCQVLNDRLFTIGQLKPFLGLIGVKLLSPR